MPTTTADGWMWSRERRISRLKLSIKHFRGISIKPIQTRGDDIGSSSKAVPEMRRTAILVN
jgi:hypothetical protein